jgi:branched-chain amino acid transport system permease protein
MKRYRPVAVAAAAVVLIQLITLIMEKGFYLTQLTMSAYYVLASLGLCLVMGYAGQISLGQAGFFALGGYTTAFLTTRDLTGLAGTAFFTVLQGLGLVIPEETLYGGSVIHLSPWVSLAAALILAAAAAWLLGVPVLRLRGHYLAMATMGFGLIVYRLVLGTRLFGEADGLVNVPGFTLLPGLKVSGDMSGRIVNYYLAWLVVLLVLVLLINLINSRVGRALRSLHGGEEAASAMGVDTARYKVKVFVIGAVLSALAGFLMTHYNGGIGPSEAGVTKSVRYVAIVAVGGMANLWGTLIVGTVLNFLSLRGVFGHYDEAVFGLVLVVMMMFLPGGLTTAGWGRAAKAGIKELGGRIRPNRKEINHG